MNFFLKLFIIFNLYIININSLNIFETIHDVINKNPTSSTLFDNYLIKYNNINFVNEYEKNNVSRIVVISDVHGDIERFTEILYNSNIINKNKEWIAEPSNTIVIQLGDQLDPKYPIYPDEKTEKKHHFDMIILTDNLKNTANEKGGDFISLIGNHELYNLKRIQKDYNLASIISKRPIILKLNNLLFCHAGFALYHLDILNKYDKDISNINEIWNKYVLNILLNDTENILLNKLILDEDAIINTRKLSNEENTKIIFNELNVDFMIVGHIQQQNINLIQNQIWATDILLKPAFDEKRYQYLDIINNTINIKTLTYN